MASFLSAAFDRLFSLLSLLLLLLQLLSSYFCPIDLCICIHLASFLSASSASLHSSVSISIFDNQIIDERSQMRENVERTSNAEQKLETFSVLLLYEILDIFLSNKINCSSIFFQFDNKFLLFSDFISRFV